MDSTGPRFYLWGFIDGSNLGPDAQGDVFVLCVPAIEVPEVLVSCLPPEVEEAICNCVVLKHDVVNMPVFLFDKVQASGHPTTETFPLPRTHITPLQPFLSQERELTLSCCCSLPFGTTALPSKQNPSRDGVWRSTEHRLSLASFLGPFATKTRH